MTSRAAATPRLAALRYRDFRLLWCAQAASMVGSQMQLIAVNWHAYQLLKGTTYDLILPGRTIALAGGALGLGALGLVRVVPIILFALLGGLVADAVDRRRIILASQAASGIASGILAFITLDGHITVGALYLLTALGVAISAFEEPAQQSLVPQLVPGDVLTNAVSLYALIWQIGSIVGPGVAGLVISRFAIGDVYAINAFSFLIVLLAAGAIRTRPRPSDQRTRIDWNALRDGLRFAYHTRLIWSTMVLDFLATFFSSARTMLPIVADRVLGVGVQGYGILATAQPAGAIIAGVALAWRKGMRRQGPALLLGVAVYGAATALFGLSSVFVLSYVLFALTGAGDTVSTVVRATIRQTRTPDHMRGRIASVHMMLAMGGPQLGELEAGLSAALFGVSLAIVAGGVATVLLTAWVAYRWPALRAYTHHETEVPGVA